MIDCRLLVDPPQDGAWNMALDEALLEDAAARGAATLRFYQWREPTLSLGYFQRFEDRFHHAASRDAAVVRRLTGGGALLHDRELTYSICLPASHSLTRESTALYGVVHRAIIAVVGSSNVRLALHGDHQKKEEMKSKTGEPLLCYARRTDVDVILPSSRGACAKIVGSAQRRRRGAVLQHGSILLDASSAAPELPGLNDLSGQSLTPGQLIGPLLGKFVESLQLQLVDRPLSADLLKTAQRLQAEKYGRPSWTRRR